MNIKIHSFQDKSGLVIFDCNSGEALALDISESELLAIITKHESVLNLIDSGTYISGLSKLLEHLH